jgi:hypothetical protein
MHSQVYELTLHSCCAGSLPTVDEVDGFERRLNWVIIGNVAGPKSIGFLPIQILFSIKEAALVSFCAILQGSPMSLIEWLTGLDERHKDWTCNLKSGLMIPQEILSLSAQSRMSWAYLRPIFILHHLAAMLYCPSCATIHLN